MATLVTPKILFSKSQEKAVCFQLCITKNSEIKPRKMIIWELVCFFAEVKGERTVDAHFKESASFLLGFLIFLKCSVLEIKNNFRIKDFLLCGLLFVPQRAH